MKSKIYPLSPTIEGIYIDDSNDQVYTEKLNEAFSREEIHNIAITGNYSIGKSRVVRLFDRSWNVGRNLLARVLDKRERFLYISLGDFAAHNSDAPQQGEDESKTPQQAGGEGDALQPEGGKSQAGQNGERKSNLAEGEQKQLEYELLCQMVSRFHSKEVPASRMQIVPETGKWFVKTLLIGYILLLVFVAALGEKEPQLVYAETGAISGETAELEEDVDPVSQEAEKTTDTTESITSLLANTPERIMQIPMNRMGKLEQELVKNFGGEAIQTVRQWLDEKLKPNLQSILQGANTLWKFPWESKEHLYFTLLAAFTILCGALARKIFRSRLIKGGSLKTSKGEMEVQNDTFSLDKYRFELVYLLTQKPSSYGYTVIFEDIDRLELETSEKILTKLRIINQMANNHLPKGFLQGLFGQIPIVENLYSRRRIRFVYVLNDEIASQLNKEKSFDYVLSIIPTLSPQNAVGRLMLNYLLNEGLMQDPESWEYLIKKIAPYLTNYRVVYSIINDFQVFNRIYQQSQTATAVSAERMERKLFAFVVYKNLCPRDYKGIRDGKSIVFPLKKDGNLTVRGSTPLYNRAEIEQQKEKDHGFELILKLVDIQNEHYLCSDCLQFIGYSTSAFADIMVQQHSRGHGKEAVKVLQFLKGKAQNGNERGQKQVTKKIGERLKETYRIIIEGIKNLRKNLDIKEWVRKRIGKIVKIVKWIRKIINAISSKHANDYGFVGGFVLYIVLEPCGWVKNAIIVLLVALAATALCGILFSCKKCLRFPEFDGGNGRFGGWFRVTSFCIGVCQAFLIAQVMVTLFALLGFLLGNETAWLCKLAELLGLGVILFGYNWMWQYIWRGFVKLYIDYWNG